MCQYSFRQHLCRQLSARFIGVDAVGSVERMGGGEVVEPLTHLRQQGVVFLGGLAVGVRKLPIVGIKSVSYTQLGGVLLLVRHVVL